jgi:excisionase family DNA binding protein
MKLWLNVADAAEHAGVCRDTIYTAVERGELRHVRIGGRRSIRVKAVWIDEWLERHGCQMSSPSGARAIESTGYGRRTTDAPPEPC